MRWSKAAGKAPARGTEPSALGDVVPARRIDETMFRDD
jgi:hypothetical protein